MRNILLIAICIFSLAFLSNSSSSAFDLVENKSEILSIDLNEEFDEGWEVGWCEGWKDVKGQYAYCPYTPYPPYPKYGEDGYRHGYNRGFKYGMCKAREYDNCKK